MKRHFALIAGPLAVAAALGLSTAASAQQTVVRGEPVARPQVVYEQPGYAGPNRALVSTGLVGLGLSYVPAAIVASQSSLDADKKLFIPVAGPWLNYANRPDCRESGIACDTENTNKVLLVADGVVQGVSALTFLVGLLTPEPTERVVRTASDKPTIHFTPASMGAGGVGAAAFGTF
jgi:hypothetical protein